MWLAMNQTSRSSLMRWRWERIVAAALLSGVIMPSMPAEERCAERATQVCAEKMRLITAYAASTEWFAIAVAKLRTVAHEEFDEAFMASEIARVECTKARRAIQKHRNEHCC